jgi:hypothetical protein
MIANVVILSFFSCSHSSTSIINNIILESNYLIIRESAVKNEPSNKLTLVIESKGKVEKLIPQF